nr:hypothetical protein B0A51_14959 [Rachicladosporium sp. CCFEE 5018]
MLERAFRLKDAIDLYAYHFREGTDAPTEYDCFTNDDWHEADGNNTHSTLHQALTTLDLPLLELEDYKKQQQYQGPSYFKAAIILGWKKLNKYYHLRDGTPAYRAASMLYPHHKVG